MAELKTSTKRRPEKRVKSVPWKLIGQVEDLLRANPNGIWVSRFHVEFKVFKSIVTHYVCLYELSVTKVSMHYLLSITEVGVAIFELQKGWHLSFRND